MKVKICGVTSPTDAVMCEESGADAVGFVHVEGRSRCLPLSEVESICSVLGPMTATVLVCVPKDAEEASDMFRRSGADVLQVHSLEPAEIRNLRDEGVHVIRAVSPDRSEAIRFSTSADALLFETGTPGTGTSYDYSKVPVDLSRRAIIAGGLNLLNMHLALAQKPYALDVSSGVESSPGKKDPQLVGEFIRRCHL